jgi:hypothetical protein
MKDTFFLDLYLLIIGFILDIMVAFDRARRGNNVLLLDRCLRSKVTITIGDDGGGKGRGYYLIQSLVNARKQDLSDLGRIIDFQRIKRIE